MENSNFLTYSELVIKQEVPDDEATGKKVIELRHKVKQEPEENFVCVLPDIEADNEGRSDGDIEEVVRINKGKVNKKKAELNINKSEFNFRKALSERKEIFRLFQRT